VSCDLGCTSSPTQLSSSHLTDCVVALSPIKSATHKDCATCRQTSPLRARCMRSVTDKNVITSSTAAAVSGQLRHQLRQRTRLSSVRRNTLMDTTSNNTSNAVMCLIHTNKSTLVENGSFLQSFLIRVD